MNLKEIINQENIIYTVFLVVAIILALTNYGTSSTVQTIAVFYCVLQLVINFSMIYLTLKAKLKKQVLKWSIKKKINLMVSFFVIGILFFLVLTDYFKHFVLYYSGIILCFLLVYDIGKLVLKRA